MDNKRFLLALVLSAAVIFGAQTFFPSAKRPPATAVADSSGKQGGSAAAATAPGTVAPVVATNQPVPGSLSADSTAPRASLDSVVRPETTVVSVRRDSGATFALSNIGAMPVAVTMNAYENRSTHNGKVNLATKTPLLKYQFVTNQKERIDLNKKAFSVTQEGKNVVSYQAPISVGSVITLRYTFGPDGHTARVSGTVTGAQGGYLAVTLPETFDVVERDSSADLNVLAYSYSSKRDGARSTLFRSLDPGESKLVEGPIDWIAGKTKYFVVGLLAPKGGPQFEEARLVGGARTSKIATYMDANVLVPVQNGTFAFDLYAGPQEWSRLHAQGRSFDEVNPYGWAFLRGVLQPIATSVIRLVLWMHRELALSYGLVLILLGVLVRIVLWPLNQSAMRSSMKMQAIQPELQALQARYKDNPEKQRTEMMKVYSAHGMSPLSPLTGCLPMLLPMPVLFALFFVFQNTIEFRGVQFLWLNDLSAHDPWYILPVIMAASMYILSWLGMRNTPPNPQAKMMGYIMPAMFLVFLGRAAAGLNLYYAAQNIAALPQQWLLTRERAKQLANAGSAPVQGQAPKKKKS